MPLGEEWAGAIWFRTHPIQLSAQMCVVTRSMEGTTWLARKSCPSCAAHGDDWMPVRLLPAPGLRNTLHSSKQGVTPMQARLRCAMGPSVALLEACL